MPEITKANLPIYVETALANAGIDIQAFPDLPLFILQSGAFELSRPIQQPNDVIELVVIGRQSRQAIRTTGNQVNVFAFSSVLLSAASATPTAISAATLLAALLGACTISLTPEQAAFFIAAEALNKVGAIPTANALALEMATQLQKQSHSPQAVIILAQQLQQLGVPLTIGASPNCIIRHDEWTVSIPGF